MKDNRGSQFQDLFINAEGKQFDPARKFGTIEDGTQLVYDDITTSYALNLPADYYLKVIQRAMPVKDETAWFIRPHHVETLTAH